MRASCRNADYSGDRDGMHALRTGRHVGSTWVGAMGGGAEFAILDKGGGGRMAVCTV